MPQPSENRPNVHAGDNTKWSGHFSVLLYAFTEIENSRIVKKERGIVKYRGGRENITDPWMNTIIPEAWSKTIYKSLVSLHNVF